jgi:hypothetical protein
MGCENRWNGRGINFKDGKSSSMRQIVGWKFVVVIEKFTSGGGRDQADDIGLSQNDIRLGASDVWSLKYCAQKFRPTNDAARYLNSRFNFR